MPQKALKVFLNTGPGAIGQGALISDPLIMRKSPL